MAPGSGNIYLATPMDRHKYTQILTKPIPQYFMLSDAAYGPDNWPQWIMGHPHYPNLIQLLSQEVDCKTKPKITETCHILGKLGGSMVYNQSI